MPMWDIIKATLIATFVTAALTIACIFSWVFIPFFIGAIIFLAVLNNKED